MNGSLSIFVAAVFGSAVQEVIYWYDLRHSTDNREYAQLLRSSSYWIITLLMIIGSGVGTVLWFSGETVSNKNAMVFGAAFPLLFKTVVSATGRRGRLGTPDAARVYFRLR